MTSSVRWLAACGGSALSQLEKCSAKAGAFNSVGEVLTLMRTGWVLCYQGWKVVFRRAMTWRPSCTISPDFSKLAMKGSVGIGTWTGSVRRQRASKAVVVLLGIFSWGW